MIEAAHKKLASICGELSLQIVVGRGSRAKLLEWAARLRQVADMFEEKAGGGKTD